AVAARSPNDAWAVGYYDQSPDTRALIEHWDGTAWSIVTSPNNGANQNYLEAVAAISANNAWAVGYNYTNGAGRWLTLVEHWNGSAWSVAASPNATSSDNQLRGVAALSGNNVWAGGDLVRNGVIQTLAERYAPSCATPTATPTPSALSFKDVAPGDWY